MGKGFKYRQITEILRKKIISGELQPGSRLPGQFELADDYNVSAITANRALNELQKLELVKRIERSGTYVADSPKILSEIIMVMSGNYENESEWLSVYWQKISRLATAAGISTQLLSRKDPNFKSKVLESRNEDFGVILLAFENRELIRALEEKNIPYVMVGIEGTCARFNVVENRRGAAMALTQGLIKKGAARPAFAGTLNVPNHNTAKKGFLDAISSSGISDYKIINTDEKNLIDDIDKLMNSQAPPDALVIAGSILPFLALPTLLKNTPSPLLGVMTDNNNVMALKHCADIASYSREEVAEAAYTLLLGVASGKISNPTIRHSTFDIISESVK